MSSLSLNWPNLFNGQGGDFQVGPTGSLLCCSGSTLAAQKLVRWLLTNQRIVNPDGSVLPADYIFNASFGIGLCRKVGDSYSSKDLTDIKALIQEGCQTIDEIAKVPTPRINVDGVQGGLVITIYYNDAVSNRPRAISFTVPST